MTAADPNASNLLYTEIVFNAPKTETTVDKLVYNLHKKRNSTGVWTYL